VSELSIRHESYQFQLRPVSLSRRLPRQPYLKNLSHISLRVRHSLQYHQTLPIEGTGTTSQEWCLEGVTVTGEEHTWVVLNTP
jgi:hypothetical protein